MGNHFSLIRLGSKDVRELTGWGPERVNEWANISEALGTLFDSLTPASIDIEESQTELRVGRSSYIFLNINSSHSGDLSISTSGVADGFFLSLSNLSSTNPINLSTTNMNLAKAGRTIGMGAGQIVLGAAYGQI